jgi:glycosyltransferase involved in cell wall biosynthesis
MSRIGVVQFQRRAAPGAFSIERVFASVRSALPDDVTVRLETNRHYSQGVLPRLLDGLRARRLAGRVNHVLGDVHYLAWFLPRRGCIVTVHDCISLERHRGVRRALYWLLWYWLPLRHAEHVTVVSEYTREALARWVPGARSNVRVIPPPVTRAFTPSPAPPRGDRLRLLQVGTAENKNLPRVIEACRELRVTLVIIGQLDRATRAQLLALDVQHENHVGLADEALISVYRSCHALIFASTFEGFGLPIIEAQAIGRPVITSRLCSMPEASGGAACLVDPFDVADIRRAIVRLIDEPDYSAELVRRGFDNAALYAPERIALAYAALYRTAHGGDLAGGFQPAADVAGGSARARGGVGRGRHTDGSDGACRTERARRAERVCGGDGTGDAAGANAAGAT